MMETAKKVFKVGIYGQFQKMNDFLEKRYNISNGLLNFSYTVGAFPEDFKKTCIYLGLKEDTKVFGVNCVLGTRKKALIVISLPNGNKEWNVLTEINWWMYPGISYWYIEETKETTQEDLQQGIEICFNHLQDFCNFIDFYSKHLKNVPKFTEIATDNNLSTQQ